MPRFQSLSRFGRERIVPGKLARLGIKPKLIHRIRSRVRHKGKPVGGIGRMACAHRAVSIRSGDSRSPRIPADGVAAHHTAAVAGPSSVRPVRSVATQAALAPIPAPGGRAFSCRDQCETPPRCWPSAPRHTTCCHPGSHTAIRGSGEIVFGALHEGARLDLAHKDAVPDPSGRHRHEQSSKDSIHGAAKARAGTPHGQATFAGNWVDSTAAQC